MPRFARVLAANNVNSRRQLVAGWALSAVLLATVIVAAAALGTNILGVPTHYGSGVDPSLGAQIARDFLADQEAQATALTSGDQSPLGGHFTDSALADVIQQMSQQSSARVQRKVSFQPASLTVLRAPDPKDPAFTIEVQEDGTETVVTSTADSAPTQQSISFHGDYWLRIPSGSHYAIADMNFQTLPTSPLPALGVIAASLVAVGLAGWLAVRQHTYRFRPQPAGVPQPVAATTSAATAQVEAELEPSGPAPEMVVVTFGGLHVRADGRDWAQELMSRPVTGFVWLRLLVAAIHDPNARPGRDELSRQASPPGLSRDVQLKRLRNVIGRGMPKMPAVLRDRIAVEPEALSFRLEGCSVDAIELLAMSAQSSGRSLLTQRQVERVTRLVQACQGDFLPEFEVLENIATDRHPTCIALMAELREVLVTKRADVTLLLADAQLRNEASLPAIALLEPLHRDRPERRDIAVRLAAAYRAGGRDAEAKALEDIYA